MFGFGRKTEKDHAGHHVHHGIHEAQMGAAHMGAVHAGEETILRIEGMTCMHCKMSVEKALSGVHGVSGASVDLMRKEAVVSGSAPRDALIKAVEGAGYSVIA